MESLKNTLVNKYAAKQIDFNNVVDTWKEAQLSPEQIRDQIMFDVSERISVAEARTLYKECRSGATDPVYASTLKKLESVNYTKLTPQIKSALEHVSGKHYRTKTASIDINWTIEMKDGVPWLKRVNATRQEVPGEFTKESSSAMRIKQASEEREPWEVYYWTSGLGEKFLEEYNGQLPNELMGVLEALQELQTGAIRESDYLFKVISIADQNPDAIKLLKKQIEEENDKRKKFRTRYEKGECLEYYRGASEEMKVKYAEENKTDEQGEDDILAEYLESEVSDEL